MTQSTHAPDPSWRNLYRLGAIAVPLYIVIGMSVPPLMIVTINYDAELNGADLLAFIADNRTWWSVIQTIVMGTAVLTMTTFAALYPALKHLGKSLLALGVMFAIASQILYLAYFPVVNGLTYMSDRFAEAATAAERAALAAGAEALVAQNNAYGPSEVVMALGVFLISIVMLKGVFHRAVAWLGILTLPAALIGGALKPALGIVYLWWWLFFTLWLAAVGFRLFQLGWSRRETGKV